MDGQNMAIAQNMKTAVDYPLNLPNAPAKPGQVVVLSLTGMGAVADPDAAGVPVAVTVGGVPAERVHASRGADFTGVDHLYFTVPAGVPFGCQVPLDISAGGVAANATAIAVTADGSPCR
jgi:uncharacterized protein (TIGR03437 family)